MSASWPGSMRGPRVKTPVLLLLLLLLSTLTGTVFCQSEDDTSDAGTDYEGAAGQDGEDADGTHTSAPPELVPEHTTTSDPSLVEDGSVENPIEDEYGSGSTGSPGESTSVDPTDVPVEGLGLIIILIPVVLVVLIIGMIVCGIFINRRWNNQVRNQELRKEDPYLDGSSTEKVPMPMFEEDVPSVLELEMEELDQWMKKDGEAAEESHLA